MCPPSPRGTRRERLSLSGQRALMYNLWQLMVRAPAVPEICGALELEGIGRVYRCYVKPREIIALYHVRFDEASEVI